MIDPFSIYLATLFTMATSFGSFKLFKHLTRKKNLEDHLPFIDEIKNERKIPRDLKTAGYLNPGDKVFLQQYPDGSGSSAFFDVKSVRSLETCPTKQIVEVHRHSYYDWAREPFVWDTEAPVELAACKLVSVGKESGAELWAFVRRKKYETRWFNQSFYLRWMEGSTIKIQELKLCKDITVNTDPDYLYEIIKSGAYLESGWNWNKDWETGEEPKWYRR